MRTSPRPIGLPVNDSSAFARRFDRDGHPDLDPSRLPGHVHDDLRALVGPDHNLVTSELLNMRAELLGSASVQADMKALSPR
jgi:hypothetical protein